MSGPLPNANLPDDLLVREIARLPLVEQVQIGQVSTRYHRLMTRALCHVSKLTIVLETSRHRRDPRRDWFGDILYPNMARFIKLDHMAECERDNLFGFRRIDQKATLRFPSEVQVNLNWLASSMPNVHKLVFVQDQGNWNVNQLVALLDNWSPTLVSLTLLCRPDVYSMTTEDSNRLFGSINALTRLQDLFLEFMHRFDSDRLDLPILGQLRRFHFYSQDTSNKLLLTSLRQYVPNNRGLRQILLGKYGTEQVDGQYMPDFLQLDRRITSKVTALWNIWEKSQQDGPMVDLLCSKFVSLTYLKLRVVSHEYTPVQLAKALSRLTQLYYLDLDLSSATNMKISAQAVNRDSKAPAGGPRLASVQVLVLNYGRSYNHRELCHIYNWPHSFPGLRVVELVDMEFQECTRCRVQKLTDGQVITTGFSQVHKRPRECIRRLTSTFRACPLIRKLMLKYQDSKEYLGYAINHLIYSDILFH